MTIEELKKYEGKKVVANRKDKAVSIGILHIEGNMVVFERNNVEVFPIKGNPRMTHSCPLRLYASLITDVSPTGVEKKGERNV